GYDVARDKGTYGAATKTAVTALVKQTGAVSEKGELFDAAWLVFLPEEGYRLASVELPLAAPAPASGTVIGSAEPVLSGAVLAPRGAVEEVAAPSSSGDDGSGAGTVATATETLAAEPDEELATTGDPITLGEDRSRVSAEGLVALRRQVESGAAVVETKLVREAGAGELLVPAAAVVATPDGATCVLRVTGSSLEPVGVEVVGDTAGSSIVKAGLEPGDEVRVAPAAKDRRCG
ncbi:MAG: hypothetical protein LBK95_15865, partial [Bifidobacteriaceae bacterium]|nr:hypothetical protein [Bifidobacteriaceae bacterium]